MPLSDVALKAILSAAVRIERKLDLLLERNKGNQMWKPAHWSGDVCPVCQKKVDYQRIVSSQPDSDIIVRICGCNVQENKPPVLAEE